MSSLVPSKSSVSSDEDTVVQSLRGRGMEKLDDWCGKWSDRCNPILIKETRQALKSRQFIVTFSLLLFVALSWTIIGTFSLMPAIYTTPSAPRMMLGYYFVLALPMLLVVPLAAYRSLECEIDDGTLELLSITSLSPWQIVLGKLASAMLQMMLYFVVLFPCIAYAYTLRGVDFPTTVALLVMLVFAGTMMTVVALFFAPMSRSRTGRVAMLLVIIFLLFVAEWVLGLFAYDLIEYGFDLSIGFDEGWVFVAGLVLVCPAFAYLLLTLAAAQLTPASENRSTGIRWALLFFTATSVAWVALGSNSEEFSSGFAEELLYVAGVILIIVWTLAGSMLVSESAVVTPRVRRDLPQSFLARATLGWLTPGPATGLVFFVINMVVLASLVSFFMFAIDQWGGGSPLGRTRILNQFIFALVAYQTCGLVLVYFLMRLLRRNNNPRVEVGAAALAVVGVFSALTPFGIELYSNDFRQFPYSNLQATNWVWTLYSILDGDDRSGVVSCFAFLGVLGVVWVLYLNPMLVRPLRTATPERVKQELEKAKLARKKSRIRSSRQEIAKDIENEFG